MINNAAIFPGQGNLTLEKFRKLIEENLEAQRILNKAMNMIGKKSEDFFQDDIQKSTYNSQILIFLSSYIFFQIFKRDVKDEFYMYAGHSLGEITALVCANVITFDEGLLYVNERAKAMEECAADKLGSMTAVFHNDINLLEKLSKQYEVGISNYNSKKQIVFSGNKEYLNKLEFELEEKSIPFKRLKVAGAFHSNLMKKASEKLKKIKLNYNPGNIDRVFSSALGRFYNKEDNLSYILSKQILMPVHWNEVIDQMKENNITNIIEFSTQPVLKNFFNSSYPSIFDIVTSCEEDYENIYIKNSSNLYLKFLKKIISIAVCSKNNSDDLKGFEEYRNIYQDLLQKCDNFISNDSLVDISSCQLFYDTLFSKLLPLKSVPESEIIGRKNELKTNFHIGGLKWEF
ncbi:malonyl CoA-ACP transacylase [Streptococcus equi subsp. zooepidemicus Sz16]|uniref:ACP S-malonyltransferase n=1 Tax=Streptococcus equi TaxID=1336 RepID=UPI0005BE5B9C|nr:ACP S-malonyltransferase [Streptococcus equi]KIS04556.1 malonyl CoA-ACP transacylase [Streptococcus equi subsp. zooepidemicus Sz16]MDI5945887.1 acyltransferase domain-containing protein [Streptococcus equi subsp. zooepidemicus]HEK9996532.1 acyltransferase domain-containing protein [Streptococcus equi subsp. zooepidemicus]HEL0553724.1 acyltransferase domain-containing protein [Streptococcus equi subsp. zooepidemicus]HEL0805717.1 acyltransferase domain-containing protein [Streptococcus equi s